MNAPAAMQVDYTDLRFIKGRKVVQVVLEIPIEAGAQFVSIFGTPDPSKTIPVGIAKIDPNVKTERKGGKLAQKAGILCAEGAFVKFLNESYPQIIRQMLEDGPAEPADLVRALCGVKSRADLDHSEEAARKFHDLTTSYEAWKIAA